jgi:glycosyltransferase involved in cell wall biosynthesis
MPCTNKPLVTIGIPFHNEEKYLNKAILSIFNQTFTNWILILIDDGSTDNSLSIAKKYLKDSRVKVLSDGLNKNLAYRLNELIDLCETKYLARMDADDIMHPDRIKIQLEILEKNPEIDVLGTNAYSIDKNDNIVGVRYKISNECNVVESFIHPSIIAKTEWYKQNRYDENANRMQDVKLWLYTCDKSNFRKISIPLLFYREVDGCYAKKYRNGIKVLYIFYKNETNKIFRKIWLNKMLFCLFKSIIYSILNLFGMENVLLKRRNLKLNRDQILKVEDYIKAAIKNENQDSLVYSKANMIDTTKES